MQSLCLDNSSLLCLLLSVVFWAVDKCKDRPLIFLFILCSPARQQGTRRKRVQVNMQREEQQQQHGGKKGKMRRRCDICLHCSTWLQSPNFNSFSEGNTRVEKGNILCNSTDLSLTLWWVISSSSHNGQHQKMQRSKILKHAWQTESKQRIKNVSCLTSFTDQRRVMIATNHLS